MPPPPDIFSKINFIWRFIADPCDAPMTVYVNSALPAALEAVISLAMPNISNLFEAVARPSKAIGRQRGMRKGKRGYKHGRPGKRSRWRRALAFDPADWFGKQISDWFGFGDRYVSNGVAHLWVAFGVIDRLLWWLLVIDVATQFLYRWTSLVWETEFCQAQNDAVLLATGDTQTILGILGWVGINCDDIEKIRGSITWNNSAFECLTANGPLIASLKARNVWTEQTHFEFRMIEHAGLVSSQIAFFEADMAPGETVSAVLNVDVPQGVPVTIELRVAPGIAELTEKQVYFQGSPQ